MKTVKQIAQRRNLNADWVLTDDDSQQHILKLTDTKFHLIEFNRVTNETTCIVRSNIVDISDFTDAEIKAWIAGYYDNLAEIKVQYGDEMKQIIAECIFEQQQFTDSIFHKIADNEEQAILIIEKYMKNGVNEQ
jgi:hypothetical protein